MAYDPQHDPYQVEDPSLQSQYTKIALLVGSPFHLEYYAKALRIYVPIGVTGTVTFLPAGMANGTEITLTYPAGVWFEPCKVRRVTAITGAGVTVHALLDNMDPTAG